MSQIKVGNAPKAIADDPEAEDTGRTPVTVVLLKSADFEGAPEIHTQGRLVSHGPPPGPRRGGGRPAARGAPVAYDDLIDYMSFARLGGLEWN